MSASAPTPVSPLLHPQGGLLLRYAVGCLYNPSTGRVAGLRPAHFVSLATPHVGCDADGLAQVGRMQSLQGR